MMKKVKAFGGVSPEDLANKINKWVEENPNANVENVKTSASTDRFFAAVIYSEKDEVKL